MAKYLSNNKNSEVFSELLKIMAEQEKIENCYSDDYSIGTKLMEEAHPEKVKILDSYTNNGIVENNIEQNLIDMEIALKMPQVKTSPTVKNAQLDFDIAASNLIDELNILASEMNVYNETKLSKTAIVLKNNIQKKANPALIGIGLGAAALSVIGWWFSSYGDKDDLKNTGVDHNIAALNSSIDDYLGKIVENMSEESLSQINEFLMNTKNVLNNVQKTRDSYMLNFKMLATQLRTLTAIDPAKGSVTLEQVKKLSETPEAKEVIKTMMEKNAKYKQYIETITPMLTNNGKFISEYFKQTSNIGEMGLVDTIKNYLGTGTNSSSIGKNIINSLNNTIVSLKMDLKLREVETNATIKSETEKVQSNLSEEFAKKPTSGSSLGLNNDDGTLHI